MHPITVSPHRLGSWRIVIAISGLLVAWACHANVLDWILPKHDVQVITVTDTTPVGALLRRATPTHPVYYIAVNLGYRDLGGIIAGDKIPPKEAMVKTIAKVLAKQGYIPATKANPPSLVLVWMWGTLYVDKFDTGSDLFSDGQQVNRSQMLRFLGAYKLGMISKNPEPFSDTFYLPGLSGHGADADSIYDISGDDLYVAGIAAYDFRSFMQKKKVLLWTTKISCPSLGLTMDETLPAMLTIAGPNIGRETVTPVWVNASDKFKPEVKIGDPRLVEYLDNGKLPIIDAPTTPAKNRAVPRK